jgi:ubiquitin-protein ligase
LTADFERVRIIFDEHPFIRVISFEGNPPEKYVFEFHIKGLIPGEQGSVSVSSPHRAEIFLPLEYPRRQPFCRMISPLFHPNVDPQKICIGDHWSAGQSLVQLVIRIAEMICYQSYNVKSPLNARAAEWVETNLSQLPLEKTDLGVNT